MRILIIGLTLLAAGAATARDRGSRVEYIGGTVFSDARRGTIDTTDEQFFEFRSKGEPLRIDYQRIQAIEYGQKADRRYAMAVLVSPVFLLSKKRQHFLTVHYLDEQGHTQALLFRVDKGDIRSALVGLEARTGRKVQYQDDEARKAGKG